MKRRQVISLALASCATIVACGADVRLGDLASIGVDAATDAAGNVEARPSDATVDTALDSSSSDVADGNVDAVVEGGVDAASDVATDAAGDASDASDASDAADACLAKDCKGHPCIAGVCQPVTIATGQAGVTYLVDDATDVYWTTRGHAGTIADPNVVARVPKLGGAVVVLNADQGSARGLAVDATKVYWARQTTTGTVQSASKADGTGFLPLGTIGGTPKLEGLVVDGSNLFVVDGVSIRAFSQTGPASLGSPSTTSLTAGEGLALLGSLLFVADRGAGVVDSVTKFTQVTTPLASGLGPVADVWVDLAHVYFAAGTTVGRIVRATNAVELIASGLTGASGIAVESDSVYFTTSDKVLRAAKGTTMVVELVTGLVQGSRLRVDATYVYFADAGAGTIARVPR